MDALIRPIFQRPRLDTQPTIFTFTDAMGGNGTEVTHDIRPSVGEVWSHNYSQVISTANSTNNHQAAIRVVNSKTSTTSVLAFDGTMTAVGDKISFGSFGNGPLYLTHDFYIQIYLYCQTNTVTFDTAVAITKV